MAAPFTNVAPKMETAYKAVVEDAASGISNDNILKGADTGLKEVPYVVCMCLLATEDDSVPGNWIVRTRVGVFENADSESDEDTPLADHDSAAAKVFDQLNMDNLGALLSAEVEDFHVYDPAIARRYVPDIEGRKWVKWMELEQYVMCIDGE